MTAQIERLFKAARGEGVVIGEQFVLWFVREQVEGIASASTLLSIAERAGADWFKIEDVLAREMVGVAGSSAPHRWRGRPPEGWRLRWTGT